MRQTILYFTFLCGLISTLNGSAAPPQQKEVNKDMDQAKMETIVKEIASASKGEKGFVEFIYNEVRMYLVSDVKHNRMRIITPVAEYKTLTPTQIDEMMQANFHKALDARYAVSEGIVYSAYIHPITELTTDQLMFAVHQVANLALTFGNGYTSGALEFGG